MALRLPTETREQFDSEYESHIVEQHGRVMKECVAVPAELLENTEGLRRWFDQSYEWIGTLRPKSTKR